MSRGLVVLLLFAILSPLVLAGDPPPKGPAVPPPDNTEGALALAKKLAQRRDFDGRPTDPKLTFGEMLDIWAKDLGLTFEVNEAAFKAEMIEDVLSKYVGEKEIPKMSNQRLSNYIRKVLRRVPSQSGVTYIIRGDHIEITTGLAYGIEIWGGYGGPKLPTVHGRFDKRPLNEALKELAASAELSIVVDARLKEKAETPVDGTFLNTPLDTAVRLLADQADLRFVHLDNTLYVTTRENAALLEEKLKKESGETAPTYFRQGRGPSLPESYGGLPPGM